MSIYAKIEDSVVVQVIVAEEDFIATQEGTWIEDTEEIKNNAGIGKTYDSNLNAFIAKKPFASWVLDENAIWQAPVEYPTVVPNEDGSVDKYNWNESTQTWVLMRMPRLNEETQIWEIWNEETQSWDAPE